MSINMRRLSPDTFSALEHLSSAKGWADFQSWQEPESVAWLAARLEFISDEDGHFPRGKWATIQRLQEFVREAARVEANSVAANGPV